MGWARAGRARRARLSGLAVAIAVVGGACGGEDEDRGGQRDRGEASDSTAAATPVGWQRVDDLLAAPLGEYHKAVVLGEGGEFVAVSDEWVSYDLASGLVDRRLGVRVDPRTGDPAPAASRDDPTLWFVHTPDGAYMHVPAIEQECGSAWADMGVAGGMPSLEPLDALRAAGPSAEPVRTDAAGTTYAIAVPGAMGIDTTTGFFADNPDLVEQLAELDATAEVLLPSDAGPVQLSVDLTDALATIGQPGVEATARWELTAPLASVDITPPTAAVTEGECPTAAG